MRRLAGWLVLLALALAVVATAGCGGSSEVREADLAAGSTTDPGAPAPPARRRGDAGGGVRISVVTHGQAASNFWQIVRNGAEAAARESDADVTYRSPDIYSFESMRRLVEDAIASRPDGLVLSLPDPKLRPIIRRAVAAGIPVVTINSGSDAFRGLGVLAHIGQPEDRAGAGAGRRMARDGVRRALCVNQEPGNQALTLRCRAFARELRRAGGRSRTVIVADTRDRARTRNTIAAAIRTERPDGILTLGSDGAEAAVGAIEALGRQRSIELGTFDLSPFVLEAVRDGRMSFAIDQQAYLQGYLPVMLLTKLARYGIFPAQGDVIATGPHFVTRANAAQAIRLAASGIR